jgi:hypothetical protein
MCPVRMSANAVGRWPTAYLVDFRSRQQSRDTCRVEELLERDISRQHIREARGFFVRLRDLSIDRNGGCRIFEACRLQCVFEDRHRSIAKRRLVAGQRAIKTLEEKQQRFRVECAVTAMMADSPSAQRRPHEMAAQMRS